MRWIVWRCPFGRTGPGWGDIAKNVPDFGIFKPSSTDSSIYSQNILWEGGCTYSMRWIEWHYPFGYPGPGSGDIATNVPISGGKTRRFNENLNNFMSSCPIRIIFWSFCSACSALQFIPYSRLGLRTPSSSGGHLNSSDQQCNWYKNWPSTTQQPTIQIPHGKHIPDRWGVKNSNIYSN